MKNLKSFFKKYLDYIASIFLEEYVLVVAIKRSGNENIEIEHLDETSLVYMNLFDSTISRYFRFENIDEETLEILLDDGFHRIYKGDDTVYNFFVADNSTSSEEYLDKLRDKHLIPFSQFLDDNNLQ